MMIKDKAGIGDPRRAKLDRLVDWVRSRGLAVPAIALLEISKPLAPIGSHMLLLLQPLVGFVGPMWGVFEEDRALAEYAALLEDPATIDQMVARLEQPESPDRAEP
jgi:hypothetical protein